MIDAAGELREMVRRAAAALRAIGDDEAARPLAPGKWSRKQVVGHLIDSASNNHQRFVRAQEQEALAFPGYDQDRWVASQDYAGAPWAELVSLWESFNLHLARVMESTPADDLQRPRSRHNLDAIAWETVPADEPVTLEYFMRDYVAHLAHHLRQMDPSLAAEPRRQRDAGVAR
jgi:hypothetical protein